MAPLLLQTQISPLVRPFRPADAAVIDRDDGGLMPELILMQSRLGPCFTFEMDGQAIGIIGAVLLMPHVASVWMCLTEGISQHHIWLSRTVKWMLADLIRAYSLHRVEAVVLSTSLRNRRWIEWLGFQTEHLGLARKFLSNGADVTRYEWVKE